MMEIALTMWTPWKGVSEPQRCIACGSRGTAVEFTGLGWKWVRLSEPVDCVFPFLHRQWRCLLPSFLFCVAAGTLTLRRMSVHKHHRSHTASSGHICSLKPRPQRTSSSAAEVCP